MDKSVNKQYYRKDMSIFWWTRKWTHIRFILRELTSLSVAFFALEIVLLFFSVSRGPEGYQTFVAVISNPILIILNFIAFVGLIFHSVTWFDLAPKAMVIKVGKRPLPAIVIAGSNYMGWIVVSVLIFWFLTENT